MAFFPQTHSMLVSSDSGTSLGITQGRVKAGSRFRAKRQRARREVVVTFLQKLWSDEQGQDIADMR